MPPHWDSTATRHTEGSPFVSPEGIEIGISMLIAINHFYVRRLYHSRRDVLGDSS